VFTPIEYAVCGMSEENAKETFGQNAIDVFHCTFKPLEWTIIDDSPTCYCKVVVNTMDRNKIIGIHVFSPNAGEIVQGYAAAMTVCYLYVLTPTIIISVALRRISWIKRLAFTQQSPRS
jgi:pyruvate/2-oxoglutarate dehydrogenase complex dihydrolipoamide dehydrogenase (E3) component